MLKTKKKTYVLLVLVLGVWGTVAYKIIVGLQPDIPELNTQQPIAINNFKVNTKIDAFSVHAVDRDPFLGTLTKKRTTGIVKKKRKVVTWLPIQYLGIINGRTSKENVFIITINGNQKLLKSGQTKDSVTLIYGNKKQITLRYKNQKKTIIRKE